MSGAFLFAYKNQKVIGELRKTNFTHNTTSLFGDIYVVLFYVNTSCSIIGTQTQTSGSGKYIQLWDLNLKKGWNEVAIKTTEYSTTATSTNRTTVASTTIPPDLKWRVISYPTQVKAMLLPGNKSDFFEQIKEYAENPIKE